MFDRQSVVIHQLASDRNEMERYYRFLKHEKVGIEELMHHSFSLPASVQEGRDILLLGDTTSFNLEAHVGRIKDSSLIGVIEDNRSAGFMTHAHLALDACNGDILGVVDLLFWSRDKVAKGHNSSKIWQERESYKWALGMSNAHKVLAHSASQTYILDRDADSHNLLAHVHDLGAGVHVVLRRRHDRQVVYQGEELRLSEVLAKRPVLAEYELAIPKLNHYSSTQGKWIRRKAREAQMQIRQAAVELPLSEEKSMPLWIVEAQEMAADLPQGETPIHWVLLTTHRVETPEEAHRIIRYYTLRWIIEQLFRTLKSEGLALEETELETFGAIQKQTVMAFKTAASILQLVYARERFDAQPIEDGFDKQEQIVLEKLNQTLEGNTQKQQNPFPRQQLSWAVWVIARLGGWKGYRSQRLPGPITIKRGLQKFYIYANAFQIFNPPDG